MAQQQKTPEERLREQAMLSRERRWRSLSEQPEVDSAKQNFSAEIIEYDASIGAYLCRLPDGSVVSAQGISPSGTQGKGSVVSLYRSASSGKAIIRWL